ncbi:hypothetical protein TanjilG_02832 [Lupinus angustifolius]|uniref:Choline kinase N-terminal domain-containing protein n=1 Tax=Lupinus angustifolius TaxID=3871 RepID=A0A4P1RLT4_LUPAN|nr:PREDICTED: probable choline kinase 2 [Lupinus angustifolius]XP_019440798.1 PREDICTED: probable choline kinase 2 [Lupinus angustifolius]OIW13312.1 hypothetical protein TanjilG_02832 [Lupinus angustifolius]
MSAAGDIVNNTAGAAENPVGASEIPLNDKASIPDNTGIDKAVGAENPASGKSDGALNHVNNQAGVAENPEEDQAVGAENHTKDQAGSADNLAKDQSDRAVVPANDTTGTTENSVNDKAEDTEDDLNDKSGDAKDPENDKADADETPVISVDSLPVEAKELLISLAGKWEDILDENALQVISLKGAMTNEVFQIKWPRTTGETSQKVILRIYGQGVDIFFDRDDEIQTFEFMSKSGYGPRLLGRFANGRVEEFIHARTLSAPDLRDPSISGLIAAKMKEFHDLDMPGEKKAYLWDRLRNWLKEAKQLSSPQEVEAFYLDTIDKEITILEKELPGAHQRIGFCHNDLQYGNIMLDEKTNSVTMIDYEYASYNPVAYDIANHFCEMAANYHTETPHILDYNKYPDVEERQRFVQAYLSSSGEQPNDSEVEQLLQEIEKYTLANHLFWGIWGIISAQVNKIDFDYKEYAKQRFQEYWARKPYLLISSEAPSPYNAPEGTGELASASAHKSSTKNIFKKMKRVLGLGLFKSKS